MRAPRIASIAPARAVEGGRVTVLGSFDVDRALDGVTIGGVAAGVAAASADRLVVVVPADLEGGEAPLQVAGLSGDGARLTIGRPWATGLHQVDNPVFDASGGLYVTYSGSRGQETPVSIFRVTSQGTREPFASDIVNATSMALGPDGGLYVSSRFEGTVYRIRSDGTRETVATELGVACGMAFDADGRLYVGDRSGTIFRLRGGRAERFASLPASVACFHLAMSPAGELHVAAPTLSPRDRIYRIDRGGEVSVLPAVFGRPQGLAFDGDGVLHVVEALAGASGVYRVADGMPPELVVTAAVLVGLAFGPGGELIVSSNETAYRFG